MEILTTMKEEAILYLDTSQDDCLAAEKLYKSKLYSQSIFYSIQAVEKICKYVAIRNNLATPSEVKGKIGHDSSKLFTKLFKDHFLDLEKNWSNDTIKSPFDFTPFFTQFQSEIIDFEIKSTNRDITELNAPTLDGLLYRLKKLDTGSDSLSPLDSLFKDPKTLVNGLIEVGIIQKSDLSHLEKDKYKYDIFLKEVQKVLARIPNYQRTMAKVILLSSIFRNNVNETRYPDLNLMKTPNHIFGKKNILVIRLPKFMKHISNVIRTFKDFNNVNL